MTFLASLLVPLWCPAMKKEWKPAPGQDLLLSSLGAFLVPEAPVDVWPAKDWQGEVRKVR